MIIESFSDNMVNEYNEIYDFLGIKKINNADHTKERVNTYDEKLNNDLYENLINFYKKDVEYLEKLLGYKTNWFTSKLNKN